jgi:DNA polymerase III subunit gamma/tau
MIGQESTIQILRNIVKRNQYGSAYLFSGPYGTGKTTAGRILSKAILCDAPINGNPCGKCESCIQFSQEKHFGYRELDAASFGGKDDMVKLRDEAAYQAMGKKKIILLDECHDITKQGQDALLKQLEQCPEHLVYIFCTTDPDKMAKTVRNRCMHFQISTIGPELISNRLKYICKNENMVYEEEALNLIAERSEGHVRTAIGALEEVSYMGDITFDNVKKSLKDYDKEIFGIVSNLGINLQKALDSYREVSSYLSPSEIYNNILSLINDASKLLYGYNDFPTHKKEILEKLKDTHGYSLLEFMNYLIHRDKFVDKIGIQSDIVLLHYKFSINSFSPKTQITVMPNNNQVQQTVTVQKKESEATINQPPLDYAQLSKMSVKDRSRVLCELRQNNKLKKEDEPTERIPFDWPLPKEERLGESLNDEIISPEEFSQNLVGGRGGV